jgi:hypothetical protein
VAGQELQITRLRRERSAVHERPQHTRRVQVRTVLPLLIVLLTSLSDVAWMVFHMLTFEHWPGGRLFPSRRTRDDTHEARSVEIAQPF